MYELLMYNMLVIHNAPFQRRLELLLYQVLNVTIHFIPLISP